MQTLLEDVSEVSDIEFEKCGEIIVAARRNVFALSCHFCNDIFTKLREFMRHVQWEHSDELMFELKEQQKEVYTWEELQLNTSNENLHVQNVEEEVNRKTEDEEVGNADACDEELEAAHLNVSFENKPGAYDIKIDAEELHISFECEENENEEQVVTSTLEAISTKDIEFIDETNVQYETNLTDNPNLTALLNALDDDLYCLDEDILKKLTQKHANVAQEHINAEPSTELKQYNPKKLPVELKDKPKSTTTHKLKDFMQDHEVMQELDSILERLDYNDINESNNIQPNMQPKAYQQNQLKVIGKNKENTTTAKKLPVRRKILEMSPTQKRKQTENWQTYAKKVCSNFYVSNVMHHHEHKTTMEPIDDAVNTLKCHVEENAEMNAAPKLPENAKVIETIVLKTEKDDETPTQIATVEHKTQRVQPQQQHLKQTENQKLLKTRCVNNAIETARQENMQSFNVLIKSNATECAETATSCDKTLQQLPQQTTPTTAVSAVMSTFLQCFKLPSSLTITKTVKPVNAVTPIKSRQMHDNAPQTNCAVTPTKSTYFKQNFTEASLAEQTLASKTTMFNKKSRLRQRKASIGIVASNVSPKEKRKGNNNKLGYKSYTVNRSARKTAVLQRMSSIKKRIFKSLNKENLNLSTDNADDNGTLHNEAKVIKVEKLSNLVLTSAAQTTPSPTKNISDLNFDLSPSVVEYLQSDLKADQLNVTQLAADLNVSVEDVTAANDAADYAFSMGATPVKQSSFEELLTQIQSENSSDAEMPFKKELLFTNLQSKSEAEDDVIGKWSAMEAADVALLSKVGLKIIKCRDEFEATCSNEEETQLLTRAVRFAGHLSKAKKLWYTRQEVRLDPVIDEAFELLLQNINATFTLTLQLNELKRIINLITVWYLNNCNAKYLEKKCLNKHEEACMQIFSFLPKTCRRIFFCEFCNEETRSETKYFLHRYTHTQLLPFYCRFCERGFVRMGFALAHEASHALKKCKKCAKKFDTPIALEEHMRMVHQLKRVVVKRQTVAPVHETTIKLPAVKNALTLRN